MEKKIDIIKVITHADGGEDYAKNVTKYPSNEYCVGLRGYGVDCYDPAIAKEQFEAYAKYHGNEGKNQFIHFMMSFLTETAPDAETSMEIIDQVLEPLKEEHPILIGNHKKQTLSSDYHGHAFVGTTNLETGKMLHPTNKLNYAMAQKMADIIQKPVELVIEKKNKTPESEYSQVQTGTSGKGYNNKNKDFKRVFYPHKNTEG
ncbi:MAG TPA: relaxase/mobilization nuclease domain-containing protein [Ruminococcus sp.]|nr:relaxase/mobilization nuclease domain-containing protein [Ruminococcus sp.]